MAGMAMQNVAGIADTLPLLAKLTGLTQLVKDVGDPWDLLFSQNARLLMSRVEDVARFLDHVKTELQKGFHLLQSASPEAVTCNLEKLGAALDSCHELLLQCKGASKLYMAYTEQDVHTRFRTASDKLLTGLGLCCDIFSLPDGLRKEERNLKKKLKSGIPLDKEEQRASKEIKSIWDAPQKQRVLSERLLKRLRLDSPPARLLEIKALRMAVQLGSLKQDEFIKFCDILRGASDNRSGGEYEWMDPEVDMNNSGREHPPSLPPEFECPLSRRVMIDPVMIASGKTYERAYIKHWLYVKRKKVCPRTRNRLPHFRLSTHFELRAKIRSWFQDNWLVMPPLPQPEEVSKHVEWLVQSGVDVHGLSAIFRKPEPASGNSLDGIDRMQGIPPHPRMVAPVVKVDAPGQWRNVGSEDDMQMLLVDKERGGAHVHSQSPRGQWWPEVFRCRGRECVVGSRAVPEGAPAPRPLVWRSRSGSSVSEEASAENEQQIDGRRSVEDRRQDQSVGSSDSSNTSLESHGPRNYYKQQAYAGVLDMSDDDVAGCGLRSAAANVSNELRQQPRSRLARDGWSSKGVPKSGRRDQGQYYGQTGYVSDQPADQADLDGSRFGKEVKGGAKDQEVGVRGGAERLSLRQEVVYLESTRDGLRSSLEKQSRGVGGAGRASGGSAAGLSEQSKEPRMVDIRQRILPEGRKERGGGKELPEEWETPHDRRGSNPASVAAEQVIFVEGYGYLRAVATSKSSQLSENVMRGGSTELPIAEQQIPSPNKKPVLPGKQSDWHGSSTSACGAGDGGVQEYGLERPRSPDAYVEQHTGGDIEDVEDEEEDEKQGDTYIYAFGDDEFSDNSFTQTCSVPALDMVRVIPPKATGYPSLPLPQPPTSSNAQHWAPVLEVRTSGPRLRPPPLVSQAHQSEQCDPQPTSSRPEQGTFIPMPGEGAYASRESPGNSDGVHRHQGHVPSSEGQHQHAQGATARGTLKEWPGMEDRCAFCPPAASPMKRPQTAPASHGLPLPPQALEVQSPKHRLLHQRNGSGEPLFDPMSPRLRVRPMSIVTMPPEKAPLYKPRVLNLDSHSPHVSLRIPEREVGGGAERPVHLGGHIERSREHRQMVFPYPQKHPSNEQGKSRQGYGHVHGGVVSSSENNRERGVEQRAGPHAMSHRLLFPQMPIDVAAAAMREMSRRSLAERNPAASKEAASRREWEMEAIGRRHRAEFVESAEHPAAARDVDFSRLSNNMLARPSGILEGPLPVRDADSTLVDSTIIPVAPPVIDQAGRSMHEVRPMHEASDSPSNDLSISDKQSKEEGKEVEEQDEAEGKEGEEVRSHHELDRHADHKCTKGSEECSTSGTGADKAVDKSLGEDVCEQGMETAGGQGMETAGGQGLEEKEGQGSEVEESDAYGTGTGADKDVDKSLGEDVCEQGMKTAGGQCLEEKEGQGSEVEESDAYGTVAAQIALLMVGGASNIFEDTFVEDKAVHERKAEFIQARTSQQSEMPHGLHFSDPYTQSAISTKEKSKVSEADRADDVWKEEGIQLGNHTSSYPEPTKNHNEGGSSDNLKKPFGLAMPERSEYGEDSKDVRELQRSHLVSSTLDEEGNTSERMHLNARSHEGGIEGQAVLEMEEAEREDEEGEEDGMEEVDDVNGLQGMRQTIRSESPCVDRRGKAQEGASCTLTSIKKVVSFMDIETQQVYDAPKGVSSAERSTDSMNDKHLFEKGVQPCVEVENLKHTLKDGSAAGDGHGASESASKGPDDLASISMANLEALLMGKDDAEVCLCSKDEMGIFQRTAALCPNTMDASCSQVLATKDIQKTSHQENGCANPSSDQHLAATSHAVSGSQALSNRPLIPGDQRGNPEAVAAASGSPHSAAPEKTMPQRYGSVNDHQSSTTRPPISPQQPGNPSLPGRGPPGQSVPELGRPVPPSVRTKPPFPAPLYKPNRLPFLVPDGRRNGGYSPALDSPLSASAASPSTPSVNFPQSSDEKVRVPDGAEVQALIDRLTSGRADLAQKLTAVKALRKMTKDIAETRMLVGELGGIEALGALFDKAQEREKLTFTSMTYDWNTDKDWNELVENIEAILLNVSIEPGYKSKIARGSGVQHLVRLLTESRTEGIRDMAVAALYSLSFDEESQIIIGEVNGIRALVDLLHSDEASLASKKDALKTLSKLSYKHPNRQKMLMEDVISLALEFAQQVGSPLSAKALSVVNNLMAIPDGRVRVAEAGGIHILAQVIQRHESEALIEYAVAILYYVATGSTQLQAEVASVQGIGGLLRYVVKDLSCTPRAKDKAEKLLDLPFFSQQ